MLVISVRSTLNRANDGRYQRLMRSHSFNGLGFPRKPGLFHANALYQLTKLNP